MAADQPISIGPEIPIAVVLAGPLSELAAESHPLHAAAVAEIASRVGRFIADLGIPGHPAVALQPAQPEASALLGLTVEGQACSQRGDPAWQAAHSLAGDEIQQPDQLGSWLAASLNRAPGEAVPLAAFLAETCLEILRDQPETLVGPAQAAAVAGQLAEPPRRKGSQPAAWPPAQDTLLTVVRGVVGLGISLADQRTFARVLAQGLADGFSAAQLVEQAAGQLAPEQIAILLPARRFRTLTLDWEEHGPEQFRQMRIRLSRELGLNLPPFGLAPGEGLTGDQFAFRINHVASLPIRRADLDGVLGGLEEEIRRRFTRLVLLPRVEAQLELVDGEVRAMAVEFYKLPDLVRLLREWASKDQTLRPLPQILELLCDYRFIEAGAAGALALKPPIQTETS